MIVCLLMVIVRDCLFVDVNGERYQQTTNHLSPLPSTNKNHLSPLPSTNKHSSLTININKQTIISHHYQMIGCFLMVMVRDDCLFVDGNCERLFVC
jgi:hypothetical protein